MAHLAWLVGVSGYLPRHERERAALAHGRDFWQLVASWYIDEAETVVRKDLTKGYQEVRQSLPYLRGAPDLVALTRHYYRGRLTAPTRFESFTLDNPMNRVLKAALLGLVGTQALGTEQSRRVRRLLAHFQDVGPLAVNDIQVRQERHTAYYGTALTLALELLRHTYRDLQGGSGRSWAFLIRTPDLVELAVRTTLAEKLEQLVAVTKQSRSGASLSFNPDLVFGIEAVGDVKYSLDDHSWRRTDVYQALAFSAVFGVRAALVLNFALGETCVRRATATAGGVALTRLSWPCGRGPDEAAALVSDEVKDWYQTIRSPA